MNSSLEPLLTQLNWKKNELITQSNTLMQQQEALEQRIKDIEHRLIAPGTSSLMINPEIEINRLHFSMQLQQQKTTLSLEVKEITEKQDLLKEKIKRINMELKMLEQYLSRKKQQEHLEEKKREEFVLEEWVLQKKESA